uniref:Uncharacterized protein n=1 Tax=Tetradesmus obliquus TaxID=3088 RepID=A0A383VSS4_TETOB|eukprot:jgi/Sobl393_1/10719/SZX67446.1
MKEQARQLEEENRQLHAREALLLAYCQTLSWLRQQECNEWAALDGVDMEQQQQQDGLLPASDTGRFSAQELGLLQQLQSRPTKQSSGSFTSFEPFLRQAPTQQQQQQFGLQQWPSTGNGNGGSTEPQPWLQEPQLPPAEASGAAAAAGRASSGWQQPVSSDGRTLTDSSSRGPAPSAAAAAAAGPSVQQEPTVAPDDDLLYYFRRIFSLPPYPGAADMTMQDASNLYNEVVRELSLNLALHNAAQRQNGASGGAPNWQLAGVKPWQNIRAAFDRLANSFVTLAQLQRSSIFMTAVLVNHADLSQPLLPEPNLDDHIRCVRQMGLSAAQKQQIADGYAVFSQLLQPVLLGMRQLQLQQPGDSAERSDAAGGGSGGNSTHSAGTGNGSITSASGANGSSAHSMAAAAAACSSSFAQLSLEGYKMHREVLHQQEQRAAQLKQLMQKDWTIKYAFCAHWMGRCTYTQLARLYVLMYPRQPAIAALGRAVDIIWKEDLARQGGR